MIPKTCGSMIDMLPICCPVVANHRVENQDHARKAAFTLYLINLQEEIMRLNVLASLTKLQPIVICMFTTIHQVIDNSH